MKARHILFGMGVVLGGIINSCGTASALTAQEDVDFYFSFNPTLGLTLSGTELVIENLMPGNSATSNSLTITASSNNAAGYKILATVGDGNTYRNTNLVNDSATFTSLALNANTAIASMANGTWGFSKNGADAYSGLPYVTDAPAVLYNADASGGSAITFAIGAKAGPAQAAGEYNNVINFALIGNVVADEIGGVATMQEFAQMTAAQKTSVLTSMVTGAIYTLEDIRDGSLYGVSKLADGNVWMTDNLAAHGAVEAVDSNFAYGEYSITTITSATYNYCNVSAGTVCEVEDTVAASEDICPAGWRLPTLAEKQTITTSDNLAYSMNYSAASAAQGAGFSIRCILK